VTGDRATLVAYSPAFLGHSAGPQHPERPERLAAIVAALQRTGLWERVAHLEPAPVDDATLELVHTPDHVAFIRQLGASGGGPIDADTAMSAGSLDAALRAVGALVEATDAVTAGRARNALCLVRPPGHHATPTQAMGFCLFNNAAIAAAWLLREQRAEHVAILDYDVHHGNGTQDAFAERADVLYVSTHQYPLYPGTGRWTETGVGTTLNIPLPPGSGDDVYQVVRTRIVEPAVRRYQPDVLVVSLGFDAFYNDPLAMLRLSIGGGYTPLLQSASELADELCQGRLVIALEGGYDLDALAVGMTAVCQLLLGQEPAPDPLGPAPAQLPPDAVEPLVEAIRQRHGLAS
jgi:acetoin utilization deacetylase AcuC-like enzyme